MGAGPQSCQRCNEGANLSATGELPPRQENGIGTVEFDETDAIQTKQTPSPDTESTQTPSTQPTTAGSLGVSSSSKQFLSDTKISEIPMARTCSSGGPAVPPAPTSSASSQRVRISPKVSGGYSQASTSGSSVSERTDKEASRLAFGGAWHASIPESPESIGSPATWGHDSKPTGLNRVFETTITSGDPNSPKTPKMERQMSNGRVGALRVRVRRRPSLDGAESESAASGASSSQQCDTPGRNSYPGHEAKDTGFAKRAGRRKSITQITAEVTSDALQYIVENQGRIETFYNFKKSLLGKGTSGSVRLATVKASGANRAVKTIPKKETNENGQRNALMREIGLLKRIDHLHIVKLYETFEDDQHIYLVMALSSHGHLAKYVIGAGCLKERAVKDAMRILISAIQYLHNNYIMHRDVKPENILIHQITPFELRLTDFGIARGFAPNQVFTSRVGSPAFMAPEVYKRKYTNVCDVWACGITMYFLLCGYLPFDGDDIESISELVLKKSVEYGTVEWVDISPPTLSFLDLMLKKNPRARYTSDQAFHHDWLKPPVSIRAQPSMSKEVITQLRSFRKGNKLKRSSLIVVASMLKTDDVGDSHKLFKSLDTNGDGQISLTEMEEALRKTGETVDQIFDEGDSVSFGSKGLEDDAKPFSYTEFIAATFDRKRCITKRILKAVFACYDKDGDGRISMAELAQGQLLGHLSMEEVAQTLDDLDCNGDCFVDGEEFYAMLVAE